MKKFLIVCACLVLVFILGFLYAMFIGTYGLVVKEYKVSNYKVDLNNGMKVVHFSDTHIGNSTSLNDLEDLVSDINKIEPDIVFFTGDLIDEEVSMNTSDIINILSKIESLLGKYYIIGNHDNEDVINDILINSGFENMNDTYKLLYFNEPFVISGISSNYNDDSNISEKVLDFSNFYTENSDLYSILLIHEPDFIDSIDIDNYDLVLAGHSHGGQVRAPFIGKIHTPHGAVKYYDEYYKVNDSDLYVSSGIGTSVLDIRLFNKPSFNFYRITKN